MRQLRKYDLIGYSLMLRDSFSFLDILMFLWLRLFLKGPYIKKIYTGIFTDELI